MQEFMVLFVWEVYNLKKFLWNEHHEEETHSNGILF